ncbi:MAG: hypothetical protein QF411_11375, partial [Planctomycetota bacterium]|nr:hypothetical protein [Planctomycetota bacterium]
MFSYLTLGLALGLAPAALLLHGRGLLEERLAALEDRGYVAPGQLENLNSDLQELRSEARDKNSTQAASARSTSDRLESLSLQLHEATTELSRYRTTVDSWETWRSEQDRHPFASLLEDFESSSRREWED